jgi:hypothetical protein
MVVTTVHVSPAGMAASDQTPTEESTTKPGAISLSVVIHLVIKSSYPLPVFIASNPTTVELYLLFPTHLASIRVLFQPCIRQRAQEG